MNTATVTVLRGSAPGTDSYGDPLPSTVTRTDVEGCDVAPRYSSESTERGRAGVIVGWTVYAPAGADVRFTDRMELPGVTMLNPEGETVPAPCAIEGEPGNWGVGVEIQVKRAVG